MKRVAVREGAAIGRQAVWLLGGGRGKGEGRNFLEGALRKLRVSATAKTVKSSVMAQRLLRCRVGAHSRAYLFHPLVKGKAELPRGRPPVRAYVFLVSETDPGVLAHKNSLGLSYEAMSHRALL